MPGARLFWVRGLRRCAGIQVLRAQFNADALRPHLMPRLGERAAPSAYAGQNAAAHPPSSIQPATQPGRPPRRQFFTPDHATVARIEKAALEIALQHPELISVERRNALAVQFRLPPTAGSPAIIHAATSWHLPRHRMDQLRALRLWRAYIPPSRSSPSTATGQQR